MLNAASGLQLTDGSAITLQQQADGTIVGVSGNVAAFAISINAGTGVVTVEQYLSLRHPDATNPDDPISMIAGKIGATITIIDGDGDKAATAAVDISTQLVFEDDGPSVVAALGTTPTVIVDETAVTSLTSTIAITIPGVAKGDDPNVAMTGAIAPRPAQSSPRPPLPMAPTASGPRRFTSWFLEPPLPG